jgi:4-nitrophenyl phosphatase
VAGKPSTSLLDIIDAAGGLDRSRACMVGDRLDTDIVFGNAGGLSSTLLVYTGVTHPADVDALPPSDARRPTHVLQSFGDLHQLLL